MSDAVLCLPGEAVLLLPRVFDPLRVPLAIAITLPRTIIVAVRTDTTFVMASERDSIGILFSGDGGQSLVVLHDGSSFVLVVVFYRSI